MLCVDDDVCVCVFDGVIEVLGKWLMFSDGVCVIECVVRVWDEGDVCVSVVLVCVGWCVVMMLKSWYGDVCVEVWDVGVCVIEVCCDVVGGSDWEVLVVVLATLVETREATATASREDEMVLKMKMKMKDEMMDENVDGVVNEVLCLILVVCWWFFESFVDGLERDFDESEGSRAAAFTVSVEVLRYCKLCDDEVGMKCLICFDCYVMDEVVVVMLCSVSYVFYERCVKEWLARDDSCLLCCSLLLVWFGWF